MAQLVRAPPCHGGGRGFESRLGRSGSLAQLGEHLPYKQRVTGSSPTRGVFLNIRLRGQAVKTSPFHGGNTGSIPVGVTGGSQRKRDADVAQLAEQLICNQQVIGSSPIIGFLKEQESLNKDH